jgi:hypothetical protein
MRRTHSIYYILFSLATLLFLVTIPQAYGQEAPDRLEITWVDTDQFPQIDVYVTAYTATGKRFPALFADMVDLYENGNRQPASITDTPQGTEVIFLFDADPAAQSHWSEIRDAIEDYASVSWMEEGLDYATLTVANGLESETLVDRTQFHTAVANAFINENGTYYEPPTMPVTPLYDLIVNTLAQLDEESPRPGMYRALVVFSNGDLGGSTQTADRVATLAQEKNVVLHTVWLGDSAGGQQILAQLAQSSLGQTLSFESASSLTPLWEILSSHKQQYTISYRSQVVASGTHSVRVDVSGVDDTRSFEITILNPAVEITLPEPNTVIRRTQSGTSENVADFEPTTQAVKYAWTWPDQHEREINLIQLRVNGAVQQQLDLTTSSDRNLVWNIANLSPGPYSLRVEVTDELGLTGQSAEIPVTIEIQDESAAVATPSAAPDVTATPEPGIMSSATEMLKSLLDGLKRQLGCITVSGLSLGGLLLAAFAFRRRIGGMTSSPIAFLRRQRFFRPIDNILRYVERVTGPIKLKKPAKKEKKADKAAEPAQPRPRPGKAAAWLEVVSGQTATPSPIQLVAELSLGRSSEQAQVVFSERTISRLHARVTPEHGDKYRVYNFSSQHTWVNEQRVPEHGLLLNDGDVIRMGRVQLRFRYKRH